jgi:phosphoenolpyruvate phosphomutase
MRAAIAGMRHICDRIIAEESIAGIEGEVATLDEVFGLMHYGELAAAEERYLPTHSGNGHAKA